MLRLSGVAMDAPISSKVCAMRCYVGLTKLTYLIIINTVNKASLVDEMRQLIRRNRFKGHWHSI